MVMAQSKEFIGLVVKATGSWYTVVNRETGEKLECKIRGKIRLKDVKTTNPIVVGDYVKVDFSDEDEIGVISKIHERRNYIIRRSTNLSKEAHIIAANIDQVFLVVTIDLPKTSREFVDRFLVAAEAYKVPATIVVNKIDRPDARIHEVVDEVLELLLELDATDEQLDSPMVFCSGRAGTAGATAPGTSFTVCSKATSWPAGA